jgi:phosphate transport system substrate-binding protein
VAINLSPPRGALAAGAALLVLLCAAACTSAPGAPSVPAAATSATPVTLPTAPASGSQTISEAGSTLLNPLFTQWATAYRSQFPSIRITTSAIGSSKGISAAASGAADIGTSDAYLPSSTAVRYPALENIPLAVSAQFVGYNVPGISSGLKLNSALLAQMYQGTITRWNDPAIKALNPGAPLPPTPIVPIHRSDGSGDTFLFTSYLSQPGSSWATSTGFANTVAWPAVPGAVSASGNSGMVAACSAHPGCIAYIGISYLSPASSDGIGEARLLNRAGSYVLPDAASISAAAGSFASLTPTSGSMSLIDSLASGAYPIVNYEYAVVSTQQSDAARALTIKALLAWIITKGSSPTFLGPVGFQPLPSQVSSIASVLIARIG